MTLTADTFAYAEKQKPEVLDREERAVVLSALLQYFHLWTPAAFIDDENLGDVGKFVAESRHPDMDVAILEQLRAEPSSAMHIVVGAFLAGYWLRRPMSDSFDLEVYACALDTFPLANGACAATALALYSALVASVSQVSQPRRATVRNRLLTVRGKFLNKNLHPGVLVSLNHLVASGQSRPIVDPESYRGYRCDDGPQVYFVVERVADGADVIHVHDVVLHGRRLEVHYEMRDHRHTDADAPDLITVCMLSTLFEDRFRSQADNVGYMNIETGATLTLPYRPF